MKMTTITLTTTTTAITTTTITSITTTATTTKTWITTTTTTTAAATTTTTHQQIQAPSVIRHCSAVTPKHLPSLYFLFILLICASHNSAMKCHKNNIIYLIISNVIMFIMFYGNNLYRNINTFCNILCTCHNCWFFNTMAQGFNGVSNEKVFI